MKYKSFSAAFTAAALGFLNKSAMACSVQEAAALLLSNLGTQGSAAGGGVRLTKAEAARTLVLREEFSKDEIRELLPELDDEFEEGPSQLN